MLKDWAEEEGSGALASTRLVWWPPAGGALFAGFVVSATVTFTTRGRSACEHWRAKVELPPTSVSFAEPLPLPSPYRKATSARISFSQRTTQPHSSGFSPPFERNTISSPSPNPCLRQSGEVDVLSVQEAQLLFSRLCTLPQWVGDLATSFSAAPSSAVAVAVPLATRVLRAQRPRYQRVSYRRDVSRRSGCTAQ